MMKGGMRLHTELPAEKVFDFLADLRNESRWNPRVRQLTLATSGPVAAGSEFRGEYQGLGILVTTLTEYERPRRIRFRSEGPRARIDGVFTVSANGRGTDVALDATVQPRGFLAILAPMMGPVFRRQNAAAEARLTRVLEGGSGLNR
jgi:hypothetical protein